MAENQISYGYQMPDAKTPDEELLRISTDWEKESSDYHGQLKRVQDQNERYYKGNQTQLERIPRNMSNAVQNHVFTAIETIIPIITANAPRFIVEPPEESDQSIKYANALEKTLSIVYEEKDIRSKGEMLLRHMLIFRFGAWIPYFDKETNEVDVRWVRPQRLFFPKTDRLIYYYEKRDFTSQEFIDEFGENKYKEFLEKRGKAFKETDVNNINEIFTIFEFHTPELTFWKSGSFVIEKRKNETFDWGNKDKNYFTEPRVPIILASAFRLGDEPVGSTDIIQQTIPIQDVINVTNRLIINNATKTGNQQWLIDSQVMTEEEAKQKITNAPGLVIVGQGAANQNLMRRDAPPPLPNYIPELKVMAENAFDNIAGTHSTTRGERGETETLGGRLLLKQSDYGRIDLLVREYERCVSELGQWFTQLMKINLEGEKVYRSYGESGSQFVKISESMIENGVKVLIKSGTTLPTDEVNKRNEALQLWGMGAIDPETLFERLKFPNPRESAEKLLSWKQGQLQMEAKARGTGAQQPQRQTKPMMNPRGEIGAAQQKLRGGQ